MSRRNWRWHPEPEEEYDNLAHNAKAQMTARLGTLANPDSLRPGLPGRGRVRQLSVVVENTTWVVLYVEKKDGQGFGGLVLHRCRGAAARDVPDEAFELAQHRLSEMPDW